MIAERFVDEPFVVETEEKSMLAVVQRHVDEVCGIGKFNTARNQMPVEAGILDAGRRVDLDREAVTFAATVWVRAQGHPACVRVDVLSEQLPVALESAGCQEDLAGPNLARGLGTRTYHGAADGTVLEQEPFGRGIEHDRSAGVKNDSLAGVDVVIGVESVPAAEAQNGLRRVDVNANRADPFDADTEVVDEVALESFVAPRVLFGHDVVIRCSPGVSSESRRTSDVGTDLDQAHSPAICGSFCTSSQSGHSGTDYQQIVFIATQRDSNCPAPVSAFRSN